MVVGVLVMSSIDCDVFHKAYENGWWLYTIGNFMMHFFPSLLILILAYQLDTDPTRTFLSFVIGYAIYSDWEYFHNPIDVYECSVPHEIRLILPVLLPIIAVGGGVAAVSACAYLPKTFDPF